MNGRRTAALLVFTGAVLAAPGTARGDMGIPMTTLLWPGFWLLLAPIVTLEAAVAKRVLPVSWKAAFRISGEANLVSTLVGIPFMLLLSVDLLLLPVWLLASFFTTVWVERRVVTRRTSLPHADVKRWSWQANVLSYAAALVLGVLGLIVFVK